MSFNNFKLFFLNYIKKIKISTSKLTLKKQPIKKSLQKSLFLKKSIISNAFLNLKFGASFERIIARAISVNFNLFSSRKKEKDASSGEDRRGRILCAFTRPIHAQPIHLFFIIFFRKEAKSREILVLHECGPTKNERKRKKE